jgi:hypothetical protein
MHARSYEIISGKANSVIFWDVFSCCSVDRYQRFDRTPCFHLPQNGDSIFLLIIDTYLFTRRHIPEASNLHCHCRKTTKSQSRKATTRVNKKEKEG